MATAAPPAAPASSAAVPSLFTSAAAGISFLLPAGWTAVEVLPVASIYPTTTGVEVYNEDGGRVAIFEHWFGGGLGGACGPGEYVGTELDSEPVDLKAAWAADAGVRFSYRIQDRTPAGDGVFYHLGLVGKGSDELLNTCHLFSLVTAGDGSILSFANRGPVFRSVAEAEAYMDTAEYRNVRSMIVSLTLL